MGDGRRRLGPQGRGVLDTVRAGGVPRDIALHQRLGVGEGDRLLDMACGSGLAIELAAVRGAVCAGIDASPRLVAVAKHRSPDADIRVGDMGALPWDDESFDIVTSFRGIWGTTPAAAQEAHRVLVPGGRIAFTCWGNVRKSPGAWMMAPFLWATEEKVGHQADMVSLGRPGVGEAFLDERGFDVAERFEVPFCFEYPDPETYARGLAATGPAYEAIQGIGEEEFLGAPPSSPRTSSRTDSPCAARSNCSATSARSAEPTHRPWGTDPA